MARKQLSEKLEDILKLARAQCSESGSCGKGGGGREVADYGAGSDGPWYDRADTGDPWWEKYPL